MAVTNISTLEDTGAKFLNNLALTDTDGSETITAITVTALPAGWTIHNELGVLVFTGNGVASYAVPAGEVSNGDFRNYTATPPAHGSNDINLSLSVTSVDTQIVNGVSVSNSKTVTLSQKISVTAVAEHQSAAATVAAGLFLAIISFARASARFSTAACVEDSTACFM